MCLWPGETHISSPRFHIPGIPSEDHCSPFKTIPHMKGGKAMARRKEGWPGRFEDLRVDFSQLCPSVFLGRLSKTWGTSCVKFTMTEHLSWSRAVQFQSHAFSAFNLQTALMHYFTEQICALHPASGLWISVYLDLTVRDSHHKCTLSVSKLNTTADTAEEYTSSIKVSYNKCLNTFTL